MAQNNDSEKESAIAECDWCKRPAGQSELIIVGAKTEFHETTPFDPLKPISQVSEMGIDFTHPQSVSMRIVQLKRVEIYDLAQILCQSCVRLVPAFEKLLDDWMHKWEAKS